MSTPLIARRFFDPLLCPNCGARLGAVSENLQCAWCGLHLTGPTAQTLGETLTKADRVLDQLRAESRPKEPAYAQPLFVQPGYAQPGTAFQPNRTVPLTPRPPREPLNVAAILLSLGALCLVVAAIVFTSFHWGSMSLGAKAVVLLAVTVTLGGFAGFVTRRGLHASAEALWAITFIDVLIDATAAKHAGLGSLENFTWPAYLAGTATFMCITATVVSLWSARTRTGAALNVTQLVAGFAAPAAVGFALFSNDIVDWASETTMVVFCAAAAYGAWRIRLTVAAVPVAVAGMWSWLALAGTGLVNLSDSDYASQLVHGHEPHLLLAVILTFGLTAAAHQVRPAAVFAFSAASFGLTGALAFGIARDLLPAEVALAPVVLLLALAAFAPRSRFVDGARVVYAAAVGIASLVVLDLAVSGFSSLDYQPALWSGNAHDTLRIATSYERETLPSLVMLAALVLAAAAGIRLVRLTPVRFAWYAATISAPLTAGILLQLEPARWVAVTVFLVAATLSALIGWAGRERWLWFGIAPSMLAAHLLALPSPALTLASATLGVLLLVAASFLSSVEKELRSAIELAALANVFGVGASAIRLISPAFHRPEVISLLAVAAVSGTVCVMSASRHWWRWISASSALIASWILASQFEQQIVEWYSIPLGVTALFFGVSAVRHANKSVESWQYYGPGLLILTVPSLVLALQDPTSVRAALVAGWLALQVAVGVAANLKAPLLIGAVGGAMLAVTEVWPYAVAAPRWVTLSLVGVALLGLGITWEDRRSDWTHAQRLIHGMH